MGPACQGCSAPDPTAWSLMLLSTIITGERVGSARTIADTVHSTNPGSTLVILVVDGSSNPLPEVRGAETISLDDLGVDPDHLAMMRIAYDRREFAAAIKPWLVRHLLRGGAGSVIYADSDTWVMGDLSGLTDAVRDSDVALIPLTTAALPDDDLQPTVDDLLGRGQFDSGLLAFGNGAGAHEMLDWWGQHLLTDCV